MRVTMVKKVLADGSACRKCAEAQERLEQMGLWDRIDDVVVVDESEPGSDGEALAKRLGIDRAPFFVVDEDDGSETIFESVMLLIRERLTVADSPTPTTRIDLAEAAATLTHADPPEVVRFALTQFGAGCALAFSGAEDVALIDMAAKTGLPFSVFVLDTGRLHAETLTFIQTVRDHYGVAIDVMFPDAAAIEALVRDKGLFSFYEDGHDECCAIRKVEPLKRALSTRQAWMTGQRADQNPATRAELPVVQADPTFEGTGDVLVKFNPLAGWTSEDVWSYIRDHNVPHNPLHDEGYRSIGCEPCTRPVEAHQHEREGRWWWEDPANKECGLHIASED